MILVTGGAGFIGANFVRLWLEQNDEPVLVLDKLTYSGNAANLQPYLEEGRVELVRGDIGDAVLLERLLAERRPRAILNFAAESHVDRSIHGPAVFVETNIDGTFRLLQATTAYWSGLPDGDQAAFRFLHVSTDEVFGSLGEHDAPFCETTPYAPNSPYAASKAASDHLVRAWYHTYGLPVLTGNCSNNYGPYQFPEKLIPLMIDRALDGQPLPVYGDGRQIRDWLYVEDHCRALMAVLERGRPGEVYAIGGACEKTNLEVVDTLCATLDACRPRADGVSYRQQIAFVADRPGHDRRYAIDAGKMRRELGWEPRETFASGIERTVAWYLANPEWVGAVKSGAYRDWIDMHYGAA